MKVVYLGACRAYHPNYDIDYNDVVLGYHINLVGDMLTVDLSKYDVLIATPPCNYYSRCNYRRDVSKYALATKDLLPNILEKFILSNKLFIVENVRNFNLFKKCGIFDFCTKYGILYYEFGRHTYFTNLLLNFNGIKQRQDFLSGGVRINYNDDFSKYNQGGYNVHQVIEYFLKYCNELLH